MAVRTPPLSEGTLVDAALRCVRPREGLDGLDVAPRVSGLDAPSVPAAARVSR
jgi:hypothetical protein